MGTGAWEPLDPLARGRIVRGGRNPPQGLRTSPQSLGTLQAGQKPAQGGREGLWLARGEGVDPKWTDTLFPRWLRGWLCGGANCISILMSRPPVTASLRVVSTGNASEADLPAEGVAARACH